MIKLSIRDIASIIGSDVNDPEKRIDIVFEWAHTRRIEFIKWVLTASVALFIPVVVGVFKGEISGTTSQWWALVALFGSVVLALFGLTLLYQAKQLHKTYLSTISLLGDMKRIAPFIQRYREQIERQWR